MIRGRRSAWTAALTAALVVVAACSGDGETADTGPAPTTTGPDDAVVGTATDTVAAATTTEPPPPPRRIGLVAPSAADDSSFTQSMVDSLDRLVPPVDVEIEDGTRAADAVAALDRLAADGVDLVVAHGTEYAPAVREVAAKHPDVVFAWGPAEGSIDLPNVFVYDARADQGGYALGAMAAALTGTGVVGVVGSVEVADVRRYVQGFAAGAASAGAEAEVTYIDSFDDETLGGEAARTLADRGAGTISATSQMSLGALAVAGERALPWFANGVDQSVLAPGVVVASQVYRWDVAVGAILDAAAAGAPPAEPVVLTLGNGGLDVVVNDAFGLDPAVAAVGTDAIAALMGGSVDTGVD